MFVLFSAKNVAKRFSFVSTLLNLSKMSGIEAPIPKRLTKLLASLLQDLLIACAITLGLCVFSISKISFHRPTDHMWPLL